jgi:DNA-binding CsgD family transcriptional regulator
MSGGLRYKEIAEQLFISTETVRTHIRNIYEKLQVNSRVAALKKAGIL